VKASNLVKIDIDGNKLDDSPYPVNRAGFVQHALFHRHLPDAHCIMHTHTTAGMAVSSVEGGLRPTNFYACSFAGQIAYHDFEGVTVRDEEGERLLANLGDKRVMLLRNHGILVMGRTLPEAFIKHWSLQRACEIQIATALDGRAADGVGRCRRRPPARPAHGAGPGRPRRGGLRRDGAAGGSDGPELAGLAR
jgi:ribulose-5-phosphate 4-epimerase/fuculose-1-phosphate aldolase